MSSQNKCVFISYRRRDSSPVARWLGETIEQNFGKTSVFVDTDAIEMGDDWPQRIENALQKSSVLITIIGPDWLKSHDEYGSRRLDNPKDWVRKEIIYALDNKLTLIPVLVSNAVLPEAKGLPKAIRPLLDRQAFDLRVENWQTDVNQILRKLEEASFVRTTPQIRYPKPAKYPSALTEEVLAEFLEQHSNWRLVDRVNAMFEACGAGASIKPGASAQDQRVNKSESPRRRRQSLAIDQQVLPVLLPPAPRAS